MNTIKMRLLRPSRMLDCLFLLTVQKMTNSTFEISLISQLVIGNKLLKVVTLAALLRWMSRIGFCTLPKRWLKGSQLRGKRKISQQIQGMILKPNSTTIQSLTLMTTLTATRTRGTRICDFSTSILCLKII
jgi:hypothetical protein